MGGSNMAGIIKYGKVGSHTMDFDKIDWFKLNNDLLKIAGSQKTLDEFFEKMKEQKSKTSVVHCKREKYDVYIGRPSKWGNPFTIGKDGTRLEVIQKYKEYILSNNELMKQLSELEGKTLGCWCKPKSCHGDVLVDLINNDKMSKCKTNTKHLYIRVAKSNSNRKMVKCMAETMKNKKDQKEEKADESKIVSDTDAWITVSDNAVFVNIPVEVAEKIPISEYTNSEGVTLKRLTLVGAKSILEKLISGEKKGVPLGYFKE